MFGVARVNFRPDRADEWLVRTRTAIMTGGGLVALGLGAILLVPMDDVKPLVESVTRGAAPDESQALETVALEKASSQQLLDSAARVDALSLSGLPQDESLDKLESDIAREYAQADKLHQGRSLNDDEIRFVGVWAQETTLWSMRVGVRLELLGDGTYSGFATLTPLASANDEPSDEPTSVETAGTWGLSAGAIVLSRESSTLPDAFPIGSSEAYWDSVLVEGDWKYNDGDGIERTLVRLVHTTDTGLGRGDSLR